MSKRPPVPAIRLRGVRHNNLKNFDLDLPLNRLIVVTGLSGSGKSSLAFDTLFAEGQRRYIETFSPYARQFFDRMDKPRVDSIEGIPPAIAIEQRNTVRTTRSTVGTMTEISDYLKVLWPQLASLYCRRCGQVVRKDTPQSIWLATPPEAEVAITFDLSLSEKLSLEESIGLIAKQGYQRLLVDGEVLRLEDARGPLACLKPMSLTVIQDRLKLTSANRARFVEACEQAYHFGKGKLAVRVTRAGGARTMRFSNRLHCAACDIEYREPSAALFSFNHPLGACPTCHGFGRIITIDYPLALPDPSKTLAQGVVKPWQTGLGAECQADLLRFCRLRKVPVDVPFEDLPSKWQQWVIDGDPDYGKDTEHEWPHAWYGVKGYFRWLESKAYKMHVRVLLSRYRAYSTCPDCHGQRFQPDALLFKVAVGGQEPGAPCDPALDPSRALTLADFYQLTAREALAFIETLAQQSRRSLSQPMSLVFGEVRSRLAYLVDVGLGYLTLDRPTRTLSGGETERVNLTTCLGTRLVNTLYVLDEPSVGLHPRDTGRLIKILQQLRDLGNTVVVVEHETSVIRAANQIVDLGPGHGESGGHVVFQGTVEGLLRCDSSLTGQYLSGARRIELPLRRPVDLASGLKVTIEGASRHNLKDLTVDVPLGRFVCVTGVSGSGKTTLVREVLHPLLCSVLQAQATRSAVADEADGENGLAEGENKPRSARLTGWQPLGSVVLVDQSLLGRTPRSNPAVYTGAFDHIRDLFAQSDIARQRGLNASAFSFNSAQGQCERCRGAGFEKIEMQFLSDVYIRCPECDGHRYRRHILEVSIAPEIPDARTQKAGESRPVSQRTRAPKVSQRSWTIAEVLEATVDEAVDLFNRFSACPPAARAVEALRFLQEAGLGYLRLGQPINTLSGGESQRLKLVGQLAAFARASRQGAKPALFLFDEPTTGLHCDDVRILTGVFQRLVQAGHSLVVIEHNLDLIKSADWVIDLGPEAGEEGGSVVIQGTPEAVALCAESHTGQALREAGLGG